MRHISYKLLLILLSCSCSQRADRQKNQRDTVTAQHHVQPMFSTVEQVVSDTSEIPTHWGNFTGDFSSVLHFDKKDTVSVEYYGQCWYNYPFKIENNKIVVYWDDNSDCLVDMHFKKEI